MSLDETFTQLGFVMIATGAALAVWAIATGQLKKTRPRKAPQRRRSRS